VEFVGHLGGSEQDLLLWTPWNEVVVSICVGRNTRLAENKGVCIRGGGGGVEATSVRESSIFQWGILAP
jgi:hypothetical protein